jgi:RecA-family ATPase
LAVASGQPIDYINPIGQHNVLVIELEGPRKPTRHRWRYLENQYGLNVSKLPIYFSHREGVLMDDSTWVYAVERFIQRHEIGLTIVDTLAKSMQGDENDSQAMGDVARNFDRLRQANPGNTVLFLHHTRKESKDWNADIDDEARGSSAIAGYYDMHWAMRKRQKHQEHIEWHIRTNEASESLYNLYWEIDGNAERAKLTMQPADPFTPNPLEIERCREVLLPNGLYTRAQLRNNWNTTHEGMMGILKVFLDDGTLVEVGQKLRVV